MPLSRCLTMSNEKKYRAYIFIDWENDKGKQYSLVAGYESVVDNFNKDIQFDEIYRYDTFTGRDKVKEIKEQYRTDLPDDML